MQIKNILIVDSNHPCFVEDLTALGIECVDGTGMTRDELIANVHQYDGLAIRSRIKIDEAVLSHAGNLKFIARAGAGMENIDEQYARSKGILCLNAPEGNRDAVGEHAIGMLLALFNNLYKADKEVRAGHWYREDNRGVELSGKTVGIIGYGNMGAAFAKKLKGFDVSVLAYDKYKKNFSDTYARESTMADIFSECDALSLHVPLSAETNYLVNEQFIHSFRKPFYFINTARGKVVNTTDLVAAIKSGKILGAALDVLEYESLSFETLSKEDMPAPFQYLCESNKVVLSPHIAGWTQESNIKIAKVLVEKIKGLI